MKRLCALLPVLIILVLAGGVLSAPARVATDELETISDATAEAASEVFPGWSALDDERTNVPWSVAGIEGPVQAVDRSQSTGSIESFTFDSRATSSESDVIGVPLLQGRASGDHAGTEIEVFRDGEPLQPMLVTSGDGTFSATLATGDYRLKARHPGWLSGVRDFVIHGAGATADLGTLVLAAGDSDGDQQIGSTDLQHFRRSVGGFPSPDVLTDINRDGVSDVRDLSLAGLNFGRSSTPGCPIRTAGDDGGPNILSAEASISPSNSLIVNVDVTVDTPSKVYVEYENSNAGRFRSKMTDAFRTSDRVSVVRLRPTTVYCYWAFAVDSEGLVSDGVAGSFTTGLLPEGLRDARFDVVKGQPTYPLTLKDHLDSDFSGIVALDSQAKIVWYYQAPEGGVSAIDQKSNGNLVYIANPLGLREITPLGEEVDRLVEPPCNTTSPQGQYHHEVQVQPNDEVLFLGTVIHPVSGDLGTTHGMQVNDTIEKWDQKTQPATAVRLFDEYLFIPHTDRTTPNSNITGGFFWRGCPEVSGVEDWTHSNSIHVGPSGNIIVLIRHLNQIIAISDDFGSLVWRLGGPGSDFSFPNSGDKFYGQHSAKQLSNGNILLFDNGLLRPATEGGQYSRALELELDTENMTATKVWEYRHDPDLFAVCCSSVARLDNGNTVLVFGCCQVFTLVEADAQGNTVWEVQLTSLDSVAQYRVYPIFSIDGETPA